jgi:hypothetical protein
MPRILHRKLGIIPDGSLVGSSGQRQWAYTFYKTPQIRTISGYAIITHPFHPLSGQEFKILKLRKVHQQQTIILECPENGSFSIPVEWTNINNEVSHFDSNSELSIECLIELCELVKKMKK